MVKAVVYGDSILRGVMYDEQQGKHRIWKNTLLTQPENADLQISNHSLFGCTVIRGEKLLAKALAKGIEADYAIIEYGGNDSDFRWPEIAADPQGEHQPLTPPDQFRAAYIRIINMLREAGVEPLLCLLPPIDAERYFAWLSRDLDRQALLKWLQDPRIIYRHQELYSLTVAHIAREQGCRLIDLRSPLLARHDFAQLLSQDGLHPLAAGQEVIWREVIKAVKSCE